MLFEQLANRKFTSLTIYDTTEDKGPEAITTEYYDLTMMIPDAFSWYS